MEDPGSRTQSREVMGRQWSLENITIMQSWGDGPKDKQIHSLTLPGTHGVQLQEIPSAVPSVWIAPGGIATQQKPSLTRTGNCQPGVCHSHLVGLLCSRMRNLQPTMEALPTPEVMLPSCSCSPHQFGTTSRRGEPMGHMSRQSDWEGRSASWETFPAFLPPLGMETELTGNLF